ncbi:MAG: TetR/AcrR family transcriptional regulator [Actinomycetia bacterium]|nr:TetR/AcrR family transcriptional regulator [Actinomycetes bacterium]
MTVPGATPTARAATRRGEATRDRLLRAVRDVVADVGYPHATTRAIAEAAGVAEGTIYRHYPDKATLFLAAVADANRPVLAAMADLPGRAGTGTVAGNLTEALGQLAQLRQQMLPLELAMLTDPDLAAQRARLHAEASAGAGPSAAGLPDPPGLLADYLAAEQAHGRVRADLAVGPAAVTILAALLGLALAPGTDPSSATVDPGVLAHLVDVVTRGLQP